MDNTKLSTMHDIVRRTNRLDPGNSTHFQHNTWKHSNPFFGGQGYPLPEYYPSFKERYEWGELPIIILDEGRTCFTVRWLTSLGNLDYNYFLPIFFDGLRERHLPYSLAANIGLHEMLNKGGSKIIQVLPYLISSLSETLYSQDIEILCKALIALHHLYEKTGPTLRPYYKKLIPILNHLRLKFEYMEWRIHPRELRRTPFANLVLETLNMLKQS